MKTELVELLACPECRGDLTLKVLKAEGVEVVDGSLTCKGCGRVYPIIDTVPRLLPEKFRGEAIGEYHINNT